VKRALVIAHSVILALVVAAPIALGQVRQGSTTPEQKAAQDQNLKALTGEWWSWALSDPSPLEGDYKEGERCEGEFVEGVFLAGTTTTGGPTQRTCTVPADTPILLPVINGVCSEAFTPPDPTPHTKCAKDLIDSVLADGEPFATLNGEPLQMQRIASGSFDWVIESDNNPFGLPAGTYDAASDGLWVYLPEGLESGDTDTVEFGGSFFFGTLDITYTLKAR
jgi:hypothetical protein